MDESEKAEFEQFRQAIVARDQDAWAAIYVRYRLLMIAWARQHSASYTLGENLEDIADQALARAWAALTPARFETFPGLAAILAYLRNCVGTVMIDQVRALNARERAMQRLESRVEPTPELVVLDSIERSELWLLIDQIIETPQERAIIYQNILQGVPPRTIFAHRPDLFRSVVEVYTAKRNLVGRLQRNPQLLAFARAARAA